MIALAVAFLVVGLWLLASAVLDWNWYHGVFNWLLGPSVFGERGYRWYAGFFGLASAALGAAMLNKHL